LKIFQFIQYQSSNSSCNDLNDHQFDINLGGGGVGFNKDTVDFSEGIYCTKACCDSEFANTVIQLLPENTQWKLSNNPLIFFNKKGLEIVFRKN
jgi:heat shock protein HslJ